jgi:hypothetical protein
MPEYVYVFSLYCDDAYYDTYTITFTELQSGELGPDIELALRAVGWEESNAVNVFYDIIKATTINDLTQVLRLKKEDVPGDEPLTIAYYRTEYETGKTYPRAEFTTPTWLERQSSDRLEGPTYLALSRYLLEEEQTEYVRWYVEQYGQTPQETGINVILNRARAKSYKVEADEFDDLPDLLSLLEVSETIISNDKFARILVLCHGIGPVFRRDPLPNDPKEIRRWGTSDYEFFPGENLEFEAEELLRPIGRYIRPGGMLYIAACKQCTYNWRYFAAEEGVGEEIDIQCLPGNGECLLLPYNTDWWEWLADVVFGARTTEDLADVEFK